MKESREGGEERDVTFVECPHCSIDSKGRMYCHSIIQFVDDEDTTNRMFAAVQRLGDTAGRKAEKAERERERKEEIKKREDQEKLDAGQRQMEEHKDKIEDLCAVLKCPRCKTMFVDFDGCFALKCRHPDCVCGFCAWCLVIDRVE